MRDCGHHARSVAGSHAVAVRSSSRQVRRDSSGHEVHEQPRPQRRCPTESVEEMQGNALERSLRQHDLKMPGLNICFDCAAQELGDTNTIERRHPQCETTVEIQPAFGRNDRTVHEADRKGPSAQHVAYVLRPAEVLK